MGYKTEQEDFWAGEFGDDYIKRNQGEKLLASKISLFNKILKRTNIESCIEFGANIGLNLQAIQLLFPQAALAGVEINAAATNLLRKISNVEVFEQSIFDIEIDKKYDLSLICGVLIHIAPTMLYKAYEVLYQTSNKYICIAEYYNPTPVEVLYRENNGKLFKRDFAGEFMEQYKDVSLIDYGFAYHRDPVFPYDDITWFLMEKNK